MSTNGQDHSTHGKSMVGSTSWCQHQVGRHRQRCLCRWLGFTHAHKINESSTWRVPLTLSWSNYTKKLIQLIFFFVFIIIIIIKCPFLRGYIINFILLLELIATLNCSAPFTNYYFYALWSQANFDLWPWFPELICW